jgi:RNA polymerase sigma-70 factor (family 1)
MNTYKNHPDDLLIRLVESGDAKAFEEIYARYAPPMFNFVRKNIALKEECQEILQDIFESLWRNRAQLAHVLVLRSYLYQAARNRIARYIQRKGITQARLEHYRIFEVVHEVMPQEDTPQQEKEKRILSLLSKLPDRCRQALELRLKENLSNKQIAERMNISLGAVEKLITRAFNHLRQLVSSP